MTFLPVVERELRVAARRPGARLARVVVVAIAFGATAIVIKADGNSAQEVGPDLFKVVAGLVYAAGLVATQVTADCMSEEKREGTLGLLFLTDLKGYDVVLGKLTATSIHSIYGMLAVVPVLAIPLLLGGVGRGELFRVVIASLNLLFFSLSIGVWASAVCRRDSRARALSIIVSAAILFGWPLATQLQTHPNPNPHLANLSSPAYACGLAFEDLYKTSQQTDFWLNSVITAIYTAIFFGLACWIAPRSWQDVDAGKSRWQLWQGLSSLRPNRRTDLLDHNPFLWRASRPESKRIVVWLMLAVIAAFWHWMWRYNRGIWVAGNLFDPTADIACLALAGMMIKLWIAGESGRALSQDRRSGALELLLSTELRPTEIVRGQEAALWRQFAWPIGAVVGANVLCLMFEMQSMSRSGWDKDDRLAIICMHAIVGFFLVADSLALSWVGMWHGFIARKPHRSAAFAFLRIVMFPALLFLLLTFLFVLGGAGFDAVGVLTFWCVLGLGSDIMAILDREKLLERFRVIASEGYKRRSPVEPPPSPAAALVEVS
jgi:ABC-type transport system involved in multi-copper enzyme maturation permease subunit